MSREGIVISRKTHTKPRKDKPLEEMKTSVELYGDRNQTRWKNVAAKRRLTIVNAVQPAGVHDGIGMGPTKSRIEK